MITFVLLAGADRIYRSLYARVENKEIFRTGFSEQEFESVWTEAITTEYKKLCDQWSDREVPWYENVKKYELHKADLEAECEAECEAADTPLIEERPSERSREGRMSRVSLDSIGSRRSNGNDNSSPESKFLGPEKQLKDEGNKIKGKVDLIRVLNDGSYWIVDYKSGFNENDIPESYRKQLLLYGYLLYEETGVEPGRLSLKDRKGKIVDIDFSLEDLVALKDDLVLKREKFNQKISSGEANFNPNPSPHNCRYCSYQIVCSSYWEALDDEWGHSSIAGEIIKDSNGREIINITSPTDSSIPGQPLPKLTPIHNRENHNNYVYMTGISIRKDQLKLNWDTISRFSAQS